MFSNVYVCGPAPVVLELALWLLLLRSLENGMLSNDDFFLDDGLRWSVGDSGSLLLLSLCVLSVGKLSRCFCASSPRLLRMVLLFRMVLLLMTWDCVDVTELEWPLGDVAWLDA